MLEMDDTRVLERATTADDGAPEDERRSSRARRSRCRSRRNSVIAMAAGIVLAATAALAIVHQGSQGPLEVRVGTRSPVPAPASGSLVLGSPADVTVQKATYEPRQSSGWHLHTGMHAVLVLSGTLTIYDADCRPHTYAAGETYVGGDDVHLATNESDSPAEMTVTYLFPAGRSHNEFNVPAPAPAGCTTG